MQGGRSYRVGNCLNGYLWGTKKIFFFLLTGGVDNRKILNVFQMYLLFVF